VIVYPTDSCYALGCTIGDKEAIERIRAIRRVDEDHRFTLVCRDFAEIGRYAIVDNRRYRILKSAAPGSYTFILKATREVPKRLKHPKRNTNGLRILNHLVAQRLLDELDEPLLSSTLILPGEELPLNDAQEIRERLEHQVDLILDGGPCDLEMTTVIDLTDDAPAVLREGKGSVAQLGISHGF